MRISRSDIFAVVSIAALFAGSALSLSAQIVQRNILSSKYSPEAVKAGLIPRDHWKPFPGTSAEWRRELPVHVADELLRRGEESLKKDIPTPTATLLLEYVRNGNRSRYEAVSFARRNQLFDLVLAEAIEDKGRFTDAIANYVWAICEETYWGVPAHLSVQKARSGLPDVEDPTVDLFGAETAATLALTDYFVGDKLDKVSPLLRKRIYAETVKKIFDPIEVPGRYSWIDTKKRVNNWDPWIMSNLITADLLIEKDEAKRSDRIYRYMQWLDVYLNGLGEDGGCDEGPSYWFAAGGSVFDSLQLLDSATGGKVNVFDDPLIGKIASYIYKMHIADNYFVNFADADPRFDADGVLLFRMGNILGDKTLAGLGIYLFKHDKNFIGEGFMKPRRIFDYLALKDAAASALGYEPPANAWFGDIQVMTARTPDGLFLAAHAGNNGESHNHNDVGDLILYDGGEPVIIDAGRGNYTAKTFSSKRYELWFTRSEYHNLPIINGFGQRDGAAFRGTDVEYKSAESGPSLSMNIAAAYPKEAMVKRWNRLISLDRAKDSVSVADAYELASAGKIQQVFMTVADVDISHPGKIILTTQGKKQFTISYGPSMTVSIDHPSMEGEEYSSFVRKWSPGNIKRIILSAPAGKPNGQLTYSVTKGSLR